MAYYLYPFLLLVTGLLYQFVIRPAVSSPLWQIPGANFSTRFSPLWILWVRWRGVENEAVCAAHKRNGPVIVLAPGELGVRCIDDGTHTIYGRSFEKPDYWSQFAIFGHKNQLSSLDNRAHATRKRRVARVFSKHYLRTSEDWAAVLGETRIRLLQVLHDVTRGGGTANVVPMLRSIPVDAVTGYMFGIINGTDFLRNPADGHEWQHLWDRTQDDSYTYNPSLYSLAKWARKLGLLRAPRPHSERPIHRYGSWGLGLVDAAERSLYASRFGPAAPAGHSPTVYLQLRAAVESEGRPGPEDLANHLAANTSLPRTARVYRYDWAAYNRLEIASELLGNVDATNATLGPALAFALFEVSRRPALQGRLRDEIADRMPAAGAHTRWDSGALRAIDDMPVLHSVVLETLRRHAPIPGVLQRETPAGEETRLGEFEGIPGGVRVSAYAHCMHRHPEVFPAPEIWINERWLQRDGRPAKDAFFWAFGSGVRSCSGEVFSMHLMKTVLLTVYQNYETRLVSGHMKQKDGTIGLERGNRLVLSFHRVYV